MIDMSDNANIFRMQFINYIFRICSLLAIILRISLVVLNRGNFLPPTKFSKAKCYNVASLLCIMVFKETGGVILKCLDDGYQGVKTWAST